MKVSWDDDIPNIWKNEKMFQSTKQYNTYNPTYSQLVPGSYPWLQPTVSDGMMNLASMCCELVQSALVILRLSNRGVTITTYIYIYGYTFIHNIKLYIPLVLQLYTILNYIPYIYMIIQLYTILNYKYSYTVIHNIKLYIDIYIYMDLQLYTILNYVYVGIQLYTISKLYIYTVIQLYTILNYIPYIYIYLYSFTQY